MKFLQLKSLLGVGIFIYSGSAQAFTLLEEQFTNSGGQAITVVSEGWKTSSITFDVDSSCASVRGNIDPAIATAINLWNGVPSANLTISLGTVVTLPQVITTYVGTTATASAPQGNPIIVCDANFAADSGESADSIPGFAAAFNMNATTGQMLGALLVLNIQSGGLASLLTLDASTAAIVLSHEIGHVLGLGHSADPNALMYYSISPPRQLALAQDDLDGITFLYPRDEPTSGKAFGCASLALVGRPKPPKGGDPRLAGPIDPALVEFGVLILALFLIARAVGRGAREV